jgi:hypothetical protein
MERGPEALPRLSGERYVCERVLGEGAMGRTYLASDTRGGQVAIKQLYPSRLATLKDLQLFMREADALRRMDHARIPSYIDAFEEPDGAGNMCYYLVQQYIPGRPLRERLRAGERFDEAGVIALGGALLEVLRYMHGLDPRVVHRDLKPENILLDPDSGAPSLVDFGAVREVVRLTMGGGSTVVGTYGYMPPEQLMGRALPATDLYALGIVLLECLTRRVPADLSGKQAAQMIDGLGVSESLKRVLRRLCAPGLDDRYASAEEVLTDLELASAGGALVHAQALERTIAVRQAEQARELARASGPPGLHPGYLLLIGFILSSCLLAGYFMVTFLAASEFGALFLMAAGLGGAGLLTNLGLLVGRYNHDAWDAPQSEWVHVRGSVAEVREVQSDEGFVCWELRYTFPVRSRTFQQTLVLRQKPPSGCEGWGLDVYYPPGNPQNSEVVDFVHEAKQAFRSTSRA